MDISVQFLALIPVVLGVVQVIKMMGLVERFLPAVSLVLGMTLVFLTESAITGSGVIQGLIIGLSASGLWSGGKDTYEVLEAKFSK